MKSLYIYLIFLESKATRRKFFFILSAFLFRVCSAWNVCIKFPVFFSLCIHGDTGICKQCGVKIAVVVCAKEFPVISKTFIAKPAGMDNELVSGILFSNIWNRLQICGISFPLKRNIKNTFQYKYIFLYIKFYVSFS